jgi:DNA-binding SARP family transcriptional activator
VSDLRQALRDPRGDLLVTRPPGYGLRLERCSIDLRHFETLLAEGRRALADGDPLTARGHLASALELWRGPPLADVAYEEFAVGPVARLNELRLLALEARISADLALGADRELIPELRQLVDLHPLQERLWEALMHALCRDGRAPEALDAYTSLRATLRHQLGLEPSRRITDLQLRILRGELHPDTPPANGPARRRAILLTGCGSEELLQLARLAEPIALEGAGREIIVLATAAVQPAGDPAGALAAAQEAAAAVGRDLDSRGIGFRQSAVLTEDAAASAVRISTHQDVDLVLLGPSATGRVPAGRPCDLGVAPASDGFARPGPARAPVVVPFGAAEHDWGALELAAWMARARGARLRILGGMDDGNSARASSRLAMAALIVQRFVGVETTTALIRPGAEGIVDSADGAGLLVLPASANEPDVGGTRRQIAEDAPCPTIVLWQGARPSGLAPADTVTRFSWSVRAS